jgi:immunity protein, SdpI family
MRNKLAWFEAALVIAPFVVIAGFWNQMPERIPIHWNIRGEIDGWASKSFGLLITPLIGFLAVALCHVVSWLDPKLRANLDKTDRMNKVLQILRLAFAAFFDAVFGVQLAVAFGHKIAAARVLAWCLLLLFAILGNYLPNLRPSYFVDIRTPWTLEDAETWRATHRLGGKLMFFGSLLLLISEFFVSAGIFTFLFVSFILLLVLWSFLYSWHHFRTHGATHEML